MLDEALKLRHSKEDNIMEVVTSSAPQVPKPVAVAVEQNSETPHSATKQAGGWKAIKYIIGNESFEKLASMSLTLNLTLYLLKEYNMSSISVVNVKQIWNGSSNVASLVGAFISDSYLGRFRTLFYGCIASLLGIFTMTLTAGIHQLRPPSCEDPSRCQQAQGWQLAVLFISLGLLSVGAGGIRPCNIAFGADQFDSRTEKGRAQLESFFNWWYLSFNIALLVAITGVVYIQTNVSWTLGFAIPTVCLVFSIAIFLLGRHTYICKKPEGSVFTDIAKVITAACRKRKVKASGKPFYDPVPPLQESEFDYKRLAHTDKFKFLDKAALIDDPSELDNQGMGRNRWRLCSLQQVERFKCLLGVLPVWVTGICCFIVMGQGNTLGILQVVQMNTTIGPHFKVPPGWLNLVAMIALSIWIFIYECICIPLTRKIFQKPRRLTVGMRINIGILLSVLSMLVAAIVEKKRRNSALMHGSFISPTGFAWLLPQFALLGFMEVFAIVAIMEFLTMQMPESMRTVAGAIFFLSLSIADYMGSLIVNVVHKTTAHNGRTPWLGGHDLNKNRLENYYFLVAGLAALNFVYFNFFASRYLTNSKDDETKEVQLENSTPCTGAELSEPQDEERGLGTNKRQSAGTSPL
ncbi:hypothetical protein L6164_014621 [Bauhinia variegata]|uniref:Uncharacterized protein n=1 Tax=Bauhinia variegata TaxID=167791 RepID=A0ACB9NIS8_BAUVA|nr:hypothetical protein L6164_014621 [Bauhinia variegata]